MALEGWAKDSFPLPALDEVRERIVSEHTVYRDATNRSAARGAAGKIAIDALLARLRVAVDSDEDVLPLSLLDEVLADATVSAEALRGSSADAGSTLEAAVASASAALAADAGPHEASARLVDLAAAALYADSVG